jgi:uncharacterized membrane protein YtjA (UPF0391 family)
MFSWAITFLIIALIAAVLGFSGIAGTATNIAWILFVVGLVLFIVFSVFGKNPRYCERRPRQTQAFWAPVLSGPLRGGGLLRSTKVPPRSLLLGNHPDSVNNAGNIA